MEASCSIGTAIGTLCHQTTLVHKTGFLELGELEVGDLALLEARSGVEKSSISTVCYHHRASFLSPHYTGNQKKCCDPFLKHQRGAIRKQLKVITVDMVEKTRTFLGFHIIAGQKLCVNCKSRLTNSLEQAQVMECQPDNVTPETVEEDYEYSIPISSPISEGDTETMDIPDVNSAGPSETSSSMSSISTDSSSYESSYSRQAEIEKCYPVTPTKKKKLRSPAHHQQKYNQAKHKDKLDFSNASGRDDTVTIPPKNTQEFDLISEIKGKILNSTKNEICNILTLCPTSWSHHKISCMFAVSKRQARKAKLLRQQFGILPNNQRKLGSRHLEDGLADLVHAFYIDDDISLMCPEKKDCISLRIDGKKVKMQKKLLLFNLKEIFNQFREKFPDKKISFSKFCQLRPAWCVTTNASDMHNVCVCKAHQNVKLMVMSLPSPTEVSYKDLLQKMHCEELQDICNLNLCKDCPGIEAIQSFLKKHFKENDHDDDDIVKFSQWISTDRTSLQPCELEVNEFIDQLSSLLHNLVFHSYVAKSQSNYLKDSKATLAEDTALVLLDFAQNYSFLIQDAVQGFHWNNKQATLHPICIYYRNTEGKLDSFNMCVISDCLSHDAQTIYSFIHEVIPLIKNKLPSVHLLKYFSDGAGGQYKNHKNFVNLCHHYIDFGINAEWHFFATSHGKSPCDGIGGTVKRLATQASLKMLSGGILNPKDLFEWADTNVPGIDFVYVSKETVHSIYLKVEKRMESASLIPGTRSFHAFVPLSNTQVKCAKTSVSNVWQTKCVGENQEELVLYAVGSYVACLLCSKWWIGIIDSISDDKEDYIINMMLPAGPAESFYWPQNPRKTSIPADNIICSLSPVTGTGRQCTLLQADLNMLTFFQYSLQANL